jgi:hypothetical protein
MLELFTADSRLGLEKEPSVVVRVAFQMSRSPTPPNLVE